MSSIDEAEWNKRQKKIKLESDLEMAYVETGSKEGKDLIFIHGYTDSGRMWLQQFKYFEKGYHVFAIDLRGSGQSDKPKQFAYPLVQLAADVISFIEKMNLKNVNLVGHSMGSMVAYTTAFMAPDLIANVVLASTAARMHETPEVIMDYKKTYESWTHKLPTIEDMHPRHKNYPDQGYTNYYMDMLAKLPDYYFTAAWWGMSLSDSSNFLQFIKAKVLIMWGTDDILFTKEFQDEMRELMPEAKFIEYAGISHEIPSEIPDRMAKDTWNFLTECNNTNNTDRTKGGLSNAR
jgi:non-heme chloroperoxidase